MTLFIGQRIFIHGAAATPLHLIECLVEHGKKAGLSDVEIMHIHTEGPGLYNDPQYQGLFMNIHFAHKSIVVQLILKHSASCKLYDGILDKLSCYLITKTCSCNLQ